MNNVTFISPVQTQLQLVEARLQSQADDRHPDLPRRVGTNSRGGRQTHPPHHYFARWKYAGRIGKSTRHARRGDGIAAHRDARPRRFD